MSIHPVNDSLICRCPHPHIYAFAMQAISLTRVNSILWFGFLLCAALYFASSFLIPFTFAIVFAMLLLPVSRKLEQKGVSRGISSFLSTLLLVVVFLAIFGGLSAPIASFNDDLPQLQQKFKEQTEQVQQFLEQRFNLSRQQQESMLKQGASALQSAGKYVAAAVAGLFGFLAKFLLMIVYVFFFLLSRDHFESFLLQLSRSERPDETRKVVQQISKVSQQYLTGRLFAVLIQFGLYAVGLPIAGVKYAVLLAAVASSLTVVPYVGTITGGLLVVSVSLVSGSGNAALGALVVFAVVQLVDEYFTEPYIVGGSVHLNPLATIVIIIIGGLLWGVAGMILFMPLLGMVKIVLDHVPQLRPYGYLIGGLGEETNAKQKLKALLGKLKK